MSDKEHFYWRNPQGIIEEHHVREWGAFSHGGTEQSAESPGKDPWKSVLETEGKTTPKIDHTDAVYRDPTPQTKTT